MQNFTKIGISLLHWIKPKENPFFSFERAVQERSLHEEHLIWLLSALTAFLWGDQLMERIGEWEMALGHKGGERRRSVPTVFHGEMPAHLREEALLEQILHSVVIPLLAHHLANDSVLDVSQHMELYQVMLGNYDSNPVEFGNIR